MENTRLDGIAAALDALAATGGGRSPESLTPAELVAVNNAFGALKRQVDAAFTPVAAEIARQSRVELGKDWLAKKQGFRSPVALIQATIDQALFSTLLTYFTGMYDRVNRRPRTKWRNGLFRRLTKGKNRDQYKHEFFERTIYATERFQELTRYILAICDPGSAEWASAARGISLTLDTVNQVTEAGYVSGVAEYDGNANVGTRQAGTSSHGHKMKR